MLTDMVCIKEDNKVQNYRQDDNSIIYQLADKVCIKDENKWWNNEI